MTIMLCICESKGNANYVQNSKKEDLLLASRLLLGFSFVALNRRGRQDET